MVTTISLVNIHHHTQVQKLFSLVMRTLKIFSLSNLQICNSVINYSRMVVSGVLTKWISSGHCKLKYVLMSLPWWWLSPVTRVNSQARKQHVAVLLPSLQCVLHSSGETEWKWVWGGASLGQYMCTITLICIYISLMFSRCRYNHTMYRKLLKYYLVFLNTETYSLMTNCPVAVRSQFTLKKHKDYETTDALKKSFSGMFIIHIAFTLNLPSGFLILYLFPD